MKFHQHLQGWDNTTIDDENLIITNQLKQLSESLDKRFCKQQIQYRQQTQQSHTPKKSKPTSPYLRNSRFLEMTPLLQQKQHQLQLQTYRKTIFSPKKQQKHSYINPILQEIRTFYRNKQRYCRNQNNIIELLQKQ